MGSHRRSARLLNILVSLVFLLGLIAPAASAGAASFADPAAAAEPAETPTPTGTAPSVYSTVDPTTGEVVGLRTRTADTYLTSQGLEARIALGSVNYQDASGAWQPIDDTLVPAAAGGYQNRANAYAVALPATLGGGPVTVTRGAAAVSFTLLGANATPTASGSVATYPNAFPGVDVAYTAEPDAVAEALTLRSAAAPASYTFAVTASAGLTARANPAGGVDFVDGQGAVHLGFAAPRLADRAGSAGPVHLTLGPNDTVVLAADPTWLADPARVYPVVLDPQVTLTATTACTLQNGALAGTNNCGGTLQVGYDGTTVARAVLQYNVGTIPSLATVVDAQLQLDATSAGASGTVLNAMQLAESWTSTVTWNTRDGTTAWTTAGGTFNATPLYQTTVTTAPAWSSWGITNLVQGWVSGTQANDGVLLKAANEGSVSLWSFAGTSSANPPVLVVTYHPFMGLQPFWTYVTHGLTARSGLAVNVANGNLVYQDVDFAIAGTGLPLTIARTYNAKGLGSHDAGLRWSLSPRTLYLETAGLNGVTLHDPTNTIFFFASNGSAFTSPAGIDADLVHNQDGTDTLTAHATGQKVTFYAPNADGHALLKSIADRNGNTISVTENANETINTITDTQGRVVTFAYTTAGTYTEIYTITDSTNRQVKFGYDGNADLTDVWDAANNHTTYGYTGQDLTKITDPLGHQTNLVYNRDDSVQSITDVTNNTAQTGYTYSFTYNAGNTVVTDPNNHATTYDYDVYGRVTKVTDAQGNSFQTAWTSDDHVSSTTDAYSHTTNYTYSTDGLNNLTKITLPTGAAVSWAYTDSTHPYYPTTATDAQGHATSFTYDANGNPKTVTDALTSQNQAQYFYNTNGTVDHVVDFNGNTTSYTYDTHGNLTKITPPTTTMPSPGAPLGATTITPDSLSRPHAVQDGKGQTTTTTFDNLDRATLVTYSDNSTIQNTYDADGNLTSMQDGTGTTAYAYDALSRLMAKSLPGQPGNVCTVAVGTISASGTQCYTYDGAGNVLSYQDQSGLVGYAYNTWS